MFKKEYVTHRREPFFQIAKDYIIDSSLVLDVGSGDGSFSNFCKRDDFYLLDGNPETVKILSNEHKHVFLGKLPSLPFEDNFFDVIHCSHVLEHLHPQDFYQTVKEMDRCLKTGGKLIISTPLYWEGFYNDLSHVRPYNPKIFRNYLCSGNDNSRTRPLISRSYIIERLQYRYQEKEFIKDNLYFGSDFYLRIVRKVLEILKKRGLLFYIKTGYTIVVIKGGGEI